MKVILNYSCLPISEKFHLAGQNLDNVICMTRIYHAVPTNMTKLRGKHLARTYLALSHYILCSRKHLKSIFNGRTLIVILIMALIAVLSFLGPEIENKIV
jgi:hypothetical protein